MHLAIAIGISLVAGVVTIRPGDYRYWRKWAGRTFGLATLGLLLSYALAGLVGFVVLGAVEPGHGSALAAAVEGLAGHAAFRAGVDLVAVGDETDGGSLLGLVTRWIVGWLNVTARDSIQAHLARLHDEALSELAFGIFWDFIYGEEPSRRAVALEQYARLQSARCRLDGTDPIDARANLRGYCLGEIQRNRLILIGDA